MKKPLPPVLVVIVNFRSAELTINSLRALEAEVKAEPTIRVSVVENDSGDAERLDSAIRELGFSDWAELIVSPHNGGYAYGNNVAVRRALAREDKPAYFLLLNPDTEVRPGAVRALVEFMLDRPEVGITGSCLDNPDGTSFATAFRFPNVLGELTRGMRLGVVSKALDRWVVPRKMGQEPEQVDWLPGASMMVRREVFETVGLMDEKYFLYYEETDFCLQARRAGFTCWYVPQSRVMHVAGQSTGVTDRTGPPKRRPRYLFESRRRYFVKNHGFLYAALADAAWLSGLASFRARSIIQRKPSEDPPKLWRDSLANSVFLRPFD
jgi:N-acetylglucosaminyl-diphospho-decaprenol L-rhamnosyltransferase